MNRTNYIISGVLAVAILVLFFLLFSKKEGSSNPESGVNADSIGYKLPIAYIRTDSLIKNYQFYLDMNESIMKKLENGRVAFNQRRTALEKQVQDYYQKAQANAYLTPERQQQEEARLNKQQNDLVEYQSRLQEELAIEQDRINKQVQDTILSALKVFNTPVKYQFIFGSIENSTIFYAEDSYDITKEVVTFLNARYKPIKE
ncbi:MAG: OmpH family outer membrane protein [Dysgonamonadaceae bacterium]|jgi:outer membrane protein|nr:OmpH family outer membrane protein [Dysgonamonadaceae bacterium]